MCMIYMSGSLFTKDTHAFMQKYVSLYKLFLIKLRSQTNNSINQQPSRYTKNNMATAYDGITTYKGGWDHTYTHLSSLYKNDRFKTDVYYALIALLEGLQKQTDVLMPRWMCLWHDMYEEGVCDDHYTSQIITETQVHRPHHDPITEVRHKNGISMAFNIGITKCDFRLFYNF